MNPCTRRPRDASESSRIRRSSPGLTTCVAFVAEILTVGALFASTVASSQDNPSPAPIPRGDATPSPAVDEVRRQATDAATRARPSIDALHEAASQSLQRTLGGTGTTTSSSPATKQRLLFFTSRACAVCDESLDHLVHEVIDRHPELAPEVVYLGNPLLEYPEAASVFVSFADDVIARWREGLRDPAVVAALARAGKVKDTSGRVRVSFATQEAESRGITEVPAFVLTGGPAERVAIGRPTTAHALEEAFGLASAEPAR